MKVWEYTAGITGLGGLRRGERADPMAGAGEVVVRVHATSLNYRDHAIIAGTYRTRAERDTIPLSDGAGVVAAVGAGVTKFKVGDRVVASFFQVWADGAPPKNHRALGAALDGMLAEFVALSEEGLVAIPDTLSFDQAATLPCAGSTAWNGLMRAGVPVRPGNTVLCLGTGGVSMMALQLARAAGARVIVTSSSDEKIARVRALGAFGGVNYKTNADWEKEVLRLTESRGVDCVIENGGIGTLARSFRCVGYGGKIALIGVLAGRDGHANPHDLMFKSASLHGIGVGPRSSLEQLIQAIDVNGIKPVIERTFPFEEAADAFRMQTSGNFIGKIVISI
jgi:NADPH:quinone reductase-like Zn-dependent oxidoreductase